MGLSRDTFYRYQTAVAEGGVEALFDATRKSITGNCQIKFRLLHIKSRVSRSTLADANEVRDWRIYADLAQSLIGIARRLYAAEAFGVDLNDTVYALDASTIDLCLSVFPWAPFRSTKAAIKL